jgi:hypothetical protein
MFWLTGVMADDVEAHDYRLGTPAASIIGMTQQLLDRTDLDPEVVTRLHAIRDLALMIVQETNADSADP